MTPQVLVPGLWFYSPKNAWPWYVGHVNVDTAQLLRKVTVKDKPMTDSSYELYAMLLGIPLDRGIVQGSFGYHDSEREGYVYTELYPPIMVLQGDTRVEHKPATRHYIEIDENSKRLTNYIESGASRIYISELSFVHELQLFLFTHTYKFPFITIKKEKENESTNQTTSSI